MRFSCTCGALRDLAFGSLYAHRYPTVTLLMYHPSHSL